MADTALDPTTRAALQKLADIALPPPVSWLPQTWGWAAIGLLLAGIASWAGFRAFRRYRANRYRREALAELSRFERLLDDEENRMHGLTGMAALLKRVALAAWPRPRVAALSGAPWVDFLEAHSGGGPLPEMLRRVLSDGEYRPPADGRPSLAESRTFAAAARAWIEGHRVSA